MTSSPAKQARPRRRVRRAVLSAVTAVAVATGGGSGWALDRYVIDHVEISDVSAYEAAQAAQSGTTTSSATSQAADAAAAATTTDTSYVSETTSIELSTVVTGSGSEQVTYFVADVQLSDMTALQSAFAEDSFGTNIIENTSDIAAANDAVLAVNGDYYGFRDDGILIRNGVIYRDEPAREGLAIYADGHAEVYDETTTSAEALIADGVWQTLSFGPAVVVDGAVQTDLADVSIDNNRGNRSISGDNPRTAIGFTDDGHVLFVVVDGRSDDSNGVSLTELGELMLDLGATTAYNLDGGGSSTMYYNGEVVNEPQGTGEERGVSDILYIAG